ncbi:ATP-dependent DNA helicase PIF1, partial [Choanephora cucurbitarum]
NNDIILANRDEFSLIADESIEFFFAEAQRLANLEDDDATDQTVVGDERLSNSVNSFRASMANQDLNEGNLNSSEDHSDCRLNVNFEDNMITGDEFDTKRCVDRLERNAEESSIAHIDRYTRPNRLTFGEFYSLLFKLNMSQRASLYHVMNHIRHDKGGLDSPTLLRIFVTGGAGTGKSMLIKTLYQALVKHYDEDVDRDFNSPTVLLTAPTGKAAFDINGQTVHSAFHLPINHAEMNALSSEASHSIGVALADLKVHDIYKSASWIDKRLREICNSEQPFGGRHVILFGDFLQLPPAKGSPIYAASSNNVSAILTILRTQDTCSSFKVHKLTEIMRQRDDALFAQALNNMALGSMTQDDISIFRGRLFSSLPLNIAKDRDNCIIKLFSTNDAIAGEYFQSDCHDQVVGKGCSAAAKLSFLKSMQNANLPAHETMGLHLSFT